MDFRVSVLGRACMGVLWRCWACEPCGRSRCPAHAATPVSRAVTPACWLLQVATRLPAAQERLAYLKSSFESEKAKFAELKAVNDKLAKRYEELEVGCPPAPCAAAALHAAVAL